MKGEWCYFKSYISKDVCEKIINESKEYLEAGNGVVGLNSDAGAGVNTEYRRSTVRFAIESDWRFKYVFDILWKTALEANKDFFNIHITKLDFFQVAEYDASYKGEYKEHHDVFWLNDDPFYHRKLSCIIQLSDPNSYEGGEFEITDTMNPIDADTKEQGTVIFFPSFLRHKANPVTKGTRYSVAAWFEGPKWR